MKKIWILLILFVFESNFAQVGIGTTTPEEALDVSGKIRVTDTETDNPNREMKFIIGVDADGVLGKMVLSPDFKITNNIIGVSGTTSYSVKDINLYSDIVYPDVYPETYPENLGYAEVYPAKYPEWHSLAGQAHPLAGQLDSLSGQAHPLAGQEHPLAGQPHPLAGGDNAIYNVEDDIINLNIGVNTTNAHETVIRFTDQTNPIDISGIMGGVAGRHILLLNPTSHALSVINEDGGSYPKARIHIYGSTASTEGQGAIELVYDGDRWILLNIRD